MASPLQRCIRYRTSAEILHTVDDIDADHVIPTDNSIWTWDGKRYKILKVDKITGIAKDQIPYLDVFVEELKEGSANQ
jgi:hypothetical protein